MTLFAVDFPGRGLTDARRSRAACAVLLRTCLDADSASVAWHSLVQVLGLLTQQPVFACRCSPPFGCGVRSTSTTSSSPLPSTAPGPRGTPTLTTAPGKRPHVVKGVSIVTGTMDALLLGLLK